MSSVDPSPNWLPVRPWTPSEPKTVPAGHASRAAVRSASKRAKRQTKHQRKGR